MQQNGCDIMLMPGRCNSRPVLSLPPSFSLLLAQESSRAVFSARSLRQPAFHITFIHFAKALLLWLRSEIRSSAAQPDFGSPLLARSRVAIIVVVAEQSNALARLSTRPFQLLLQ